MIDLAILHDRLRTVLPQLSIKHGVLENSETRVRHPALIIETEERTPGHVYRMSIMIVDDRVSFFVHVCGESKDLTTEGTQHFSKVCVDDDEVFIIVHSCWTGDLAA